MRWSKYRNKKTEIDGIVFDSKAEANRYLDLKFFETNGMISNLQRQVKFELIPAQKGYLRSERPVTYIADFVYDEDGVTVVEDVKGMRTDAYKIKRKLMKYVYDIEVREIE